MICIGIKANKVKAMLQFDTEAEYVDMAHEFDLLLDASGYATQPQLGWDYDASLNQFNYGQLLAKPSIKITKLAFRNRFTAAEKAATIVFAWNNLSNANAQVQAIAAQLLVSLDNQRDATYIDLARTDTIAGVLGLVALQAYGINLLTQPRAEAILYTPPTFDETYKG